MATTASEKEILELSNSQTLILSGQQLQPGEPLYNMVFTFRIDGALDPVAFDVAFNALVRSCENLRTVIRDTPDGPRQEIFATGTSSLQFHDFSTHALPQQSFDAWVAEHSCRTFTLHESLFESALFKLGEQRFVWYLNQHHLVTDAWTVSLMFQRLQTLYREARVADIAVTDPAPGVAAYLAHEAASAGFAIASRAREHWDAQSKVEVKAPRFYRDTPRARVGRTVRYPCALGRDRTERIERLIATPDFSGISRELSCMQVFATALFTVLYRVSGEDRLAVATPCHARSTPALRDTLGVLINIF
ncbi:MAG: condensation domain-containing protein, partial [Thiogranum sp.]